MVEVNRPEREDNHITIGFKHELFTFTGQVLLAAIRNPMISARLGLPTLTGNWSSPIFRSRRTIRALDSLSHERTSLVRKFPPGPKIIVANHSAPEHLFPAVARRMPQNEKFPYTPCDILSPYRILQSDKASAIQKWFARILLQMDLTLPFMLPSIPSSEKEKLPEMFESARVEGKIYTGLSLLRRLREIIQEEPSSSFLILIEGKPSRGTDLNPPDQSLVDITNFLLRNMPGAPLIFLACNNTKAEVRQRLLTSDQLKRDTVQTDKPDFFEENLRRLLDLTIE
ncbi:MAG: hypothetical protein PHS44_01425 [Candidatus Dojkabacteria bacterium]|nr:hypothetical protein [Candidatus Dojkabacteria bacterium]